MKKTPTIHVIARAVVKFKGRLLLAHAKGASNTFLPGGHVEPGESMPVTLRREMEEEFGMTAEVRRYLGVVEHYWNQDGVDNFEICHVFEATIPGLGSFDDIVSREAHLEFIWADPSELSSHNLQPSPLASVLASPLPQEAPALWASTHPKAGSEAVAGLRSVTT